MEDLIIQIRVIAERNEWHEIDHQEQNSMISFIRKDSRINVYYARPWRMTVATTVNHPTMGRQQLFRKFIRMPELREIFRNPRVHTDRGYYRKHGTSKQKVAKPAMQDVPEVRPGIGTMQGQDNSVRMQGAGV